MKAGYYLLCMLLFVACKGKQTSAASDSAVVSDTATIVTKKTKVIDTVFKPYKLIDNFIVTDTGYFDFVVGGGFFEVVEQQGKLVDTIDREFGIQKLNTGEYIYQKINGSGPLPAGESTYGNKLAMQGDLGEYIIITQNSKKPFHTLTSNFDFYFSSPQVINGKVYFWQIEKLKSGNNHISAAEFNPLTRKTVKQYYLTTTLKLMLPFISIFLKKEMTRFFSEITNSILILS